MYKIILLIQYISIVGLFIESWIVFRRLNSRLHSYLFFSCIASLVNDMGYLFEICATTEEAYLAALKMSYLGRVWTAYALFLFTTELCGLRIPTVIKTLFALFNAATYVVIFTTPAHELYYKDVEFIMVGEMPIMKHSDGIWHDVFSVVIGFYIVFALIALFITYYKEHDRTAKKRLSVVIVAIVTESVFTSVQLFVNTPLTNVYDLTMPGFMIGTFFMLVAIIRYDLLGTEQLAKEYIVDELSEGIVAADAKGHVAYFNKPARKLFPDLPINAEGVVENLKRSIEANETILLNDRIYTPKTDTIYKGIRKSGTLYVLQDNTELYRHAKELEEMTEKANAANEAKSSFLANMSHDIRTPINAVLGMNEMILRESTEPDILSYSENIRTAGRTLLSLINDILDFSKIEEGGMEIIPVQYELGSMINDLVNMIHDRAEQKGLKFEVEVDKNIPHLLCGDEIRIKQCVLNLLTNAVKYTEKGSVRFTVGYESADGNNINLTFRVKDTGIGMKQEDMDKLFSPFMRIEEKRNRNIEGTGLGMSITKQLLELMGSSLEVQSVYGEGSEFGFAVMQEVVGSEPVGDYSVRYLSEKERTAYRELFHAPDARILVVDDTPVNLAVIKGLLKTTQVCVDTASGGREALEKASAQKYDIIFIDHMMPDMDGIETLNELRKLPGYADTVCVALTANAISGAREMYIEAGFSDYLSKPVDGEKLEQMLVHYLPAEKILKIDADEKNGSGADTVQLPEKLYDIGEINIESGLKHCGTPDVYLETLSVYASTAAANCSEIEQLWQSGDVAGATIKIHALKSTSRAIGADDLGALAEKLEAAGKANDTNTLGAEIDTLTERYGSLGNALTELFGESGSDDGKPLISDDMLEKSYAAIREFAENFDIDGAALTIEGLAKYRLPVSEKERYKRLKEAADSFDWDAVNEIAGGK